MNFKIAKTMYETTRKRKLANNTYLVKIWGSTCVVGYGIELHGNLIIKFYPNRTVLNSCGWFTQTVKNRFNQFVDGIAISQKDFKWYIRKNSDGCIVDFKDGMVLRLYQDGRI